MLVSMRLEPFEVSHGGKLFFGLLFAGVAAILLVAGKVVENSQGENKKGYPHDQVEGVQHFPII